MSSVTYTHPYKQPSSPTFKYMREADGSLADPMNLAPEELYEEIVECGIPLLSALECVARGWAHGNPLAMIMRAAQYACCDKPKASVMTQIGSKPIPIQLLAAYVTDSGIGKGLTMSALLSLATPGACFRKVTPASGELLISEFFEQVPAADGKGVETQRHDDPVWADWNEIDALAAKSGSSTSTLDAVLRSLWTGEDAGDSSISRKKAGIGCTVEAGTYRSVGSVGAQLAHCDSFLADTTGGTLQRLLWVPLYDDGAVDLDDAIRIYRRRLEVLCAAPAGKFGRGAPGIDVWGPHGEIKILDEIDRIIYSNRTSTLRRDPLPGGEKRDPLDTHKDNNRVRLAAIFAGWRAGVGGEPVIDMDAWWWAGCFLEVSRRAREDAKSETQKERERKERNEGKLQGIREIAKKSAIKDDEELMRLRIRAKFIRRAEKVVAQTNVGPTKNMLRGCLTGSDERALFDKDFPTVVKSGALQEVQDGKVLRYVPGDAEVIEQIKLEADAANKKDAA